MKRERKQTVGAAIKAKAKAPVGPRYSIGPIRLEKPSAGAAEPPSLKHATAKTTDAPSRPSPSDRYSDAANRFVVDMLTLWNYVKSISQFAAETANKNDDRFATTVMSLLNSRPKPTGKAIARVRIELIPDSAPRESRHVIRDITSIAELKKLLELDEQTTKISRLLHETAIQHIANVFEHLLSDLYAAHYHGHPDSIAEDRSISYKEVLSIGNMDEAHDFLISQEAQRFVHEPSEKQIELIDRFTKGALTKNFSELNLLLEVLLRRHAIVHARGRASAEYLRRIKPLGLKTPAPKAGVPLVTNHGYVDTAFNLVFAAGSIIAETCWKKSQPKDSGHTDRFLNNAGISALEKGHARAALWIFTYACAREDQEDDEVGPLVAKINLAQSHKWAKDEAKATELASKAKWRTSNPVFQLCAAAIREDVAEFRRLLPLAAKEDDFIAAVDLYKWPVFGWLRPRPDFDAWVGEAFGEVPNVSTGILLHAPPAQPAAGSRNGGSPALPTASDGAGGTGGPAS